MKSNNILKKIRTISLAIYIFLAIFPEASNKFLAIGTIGIWLISSALLNKNEFFNFFIKPNWIIYPVYIWIISCLLYAFIGYATDQIYIINFIRIAITSVIYLYYEKEKNSNKDIKFIAIYSIIVIMLVNLITIIINIKYHNISRILSTGMETLQDTTGIGSYFHIYGLIYPAIILIAYLLNKNTANKILNLKEKKVNIFNLLILIFIITSLYAIYITEFLIAYILLIIGILFIIFNINTFKKFLLITMIFVIVVMMFLPFIKNMFKNIAENTDSNNIRIRTNDFYILISEKNIENTIDIKARVEVYMKSINLFVNNPLLGIGLNNDETSSMIGRHSTLLDNLALYGIIGNIPMFVYIIMLYIQIYKTFINKWCKNVYIICLAMFSIFITINTSMYVAIFYMLFVLSPMILKMIENENLIKKEEKTNENTMDS